MVKAIPTMKLVQIQHMVEIENLLKIGRQFFCPMSINAIVNKNAGKMTM